MDKPLVWIDCEMTGLNHETDKIIEISCFLTNGKLEFLEPYGFTRVVHCDDAKLDGMDDWCKNTHGKSGLIEKVRASTNTTESVQAELMKYLKALTGPKMGVLAGNSVHVDRLFLLKQFPELVNYLHYRIVDVSTIKEIGYRQNPKLMSKVPPKALNHTAKDDILESINELKWYYKNYFVKPE